MKPRIIHISRPRRRGTSPIKLLGILATVIIMIYYIFRSEKQSLHFDDAEIKSFNHNYPENFESKTENESLQEEFVEESSEEEKSFEEAVMPVVQKDEPGLEVASIDSRKKFLKEFVEAKDEEAAEEPKDKLENKLADVGKESLKVPELEKNEAAENAGKQLQDPKAVEPILPNNETMLEAPNANQANSTNTKQEDETAAKALANLKALEEKLVEIKKNDTLKVPEPETKPMDEVQQVLQEPEAAVPVLKNNNTILEILEAVKLDTPTNSTNTKPKDEKSVEKLVASLETLEKELKDEVEMDTLKIQDPEKVSTNTKLEDDIAFKALENFKALEEKLEGLVEEDTLKVPGPEKDSSDVNDKEVLQQKVLEAPEENEETSAVTEEINEKLEKTKLEAMTNETKWSFVPPMNIFGVENVGEMGKPVMMPAKIPEDIQKIYDEGWKNNEFNQYLSDLISVNRTLPDYRTDYCKNIVATYSKKLPATSVIIIFHNEAWTTLLRSVHSVLNRSPEHLISEVILVDDCSTMEHLKQPLDDYMSQFPKVKVVRTETRGGLIKARIMGAILATGPVLTFLDSHIECSPGWLEPMLDRIAIDPTNVVCPLIESVNDTTFEYDFHKRLDNMRVGGFDWGLSFYWHTLSETEKKRKKDPSEPTRSPAMAGGLFSIDKAFFLKLDMYDPGFDIWGAENLELSFKTWMCGGTLEIVPCSRVGHIYRKKCPYEWRKDSNPMRVNNIRLAEVWIDDYSKFFYTRTGPANVDYGDISQRKKLRKDLDCKSFEWYVNNIYPELELPSDGDAYGEIRNLGFNGRKCLDATSEKEMAATGIKCHGIGGHQYWEFRDGKIKRDRYSIHFDPPNIMFKKDHHKDTSSQIWKFNADTKQLFLEDEATKCLSLTKDSKLVMEKCEATAENQKWKLEHSKTDKI